MLTKQCTRCGNEKEIDQFPLCRGVPRARCKPCHSQDAMGWATKNQDKYKARLKSWHRKNKQPRFMGPPLPDHEKKRRALASGKRWRTDNAEKFKEIRADWNRRNPTDMLARCRKRQAKLIQAIPGWANDFFIAEIYDLRARRQKMLGIEFDVDHIVPLNSKYVCGLHVEYNLRILPTSENRSKGNRVWPDMP